MSNIYFPEEQISFNDIFFVCYMIERTARHIKQPNRYVVQQMGKAALERQLSIAGTNHCLNPDQVMEEWTDEYSLVSGSFDVTRLDPEYTDKVPSCTQMGKVYARIVESLTSENGNLADSILNVYGSPVCDYIDNYNTSAYYEPSYVQIRAFQQGGF